MRTLPMTHYQGASLTPLYLGHHHDGVCYKHGKGSFQQTIHKCDQ